MDTPPQSSWRRPASIAGALLVLDAALTFENIWPTPAIWWRGLLSVELAACLLLLIAVRARRGNLPASLVAWLSAAWTLLAVARYAEVTAPALYGRDVNLYWDLRLMPDVIAMITRVAPWWLVTVAVAVAAGVLWLFNRLFRWAFRRTLQALDDPSNRRRIAGGAVTVVLLFAAQHLGASFPGLLPNPVLATCVKQASLVLAGWRGVTSLPPTPPMESTFANIAGADVYLVFIESYGAVTDRPDVANGLANSRRQLESDIRTTGRQVVSALVESPTFGGSSWLAPISLLSGIELRDPDTNAMLMTQQRETLVKAFATKGF